jgi:hypothetical protein
MACGEWRWPVKTLSDPLAGKVHYKDILNRKVPFLRGLPAPGGLSTDTPRLPGVERRVYRIHVALLKAKVEDDHDIHLVVAGPAAKSKTMIVEFPSVKCQGAATSNHRPAMARARNALLADCGSIGSSSFVSLKGTATLTGVGFWDEKHGQTGVAPNGIELHPILSYSSGTCSKASSGGGGGGNNCTPGYSPCLVWHGGADYDCYGGGGNGPYYTAPNTAYKVPPSDPYRLDNDNDGYGCDG